MTDISAILTSISTAIQIAKDLREADNAIERAELRLKLSEVVNGLADAKLAIAEMRDEIYSRELQINELQLALEFKAKLVRHGDAYYETGAQGQATGSPYCLRCFDNDHKCRQLTTKAGAIYFRVCTTCGTQYDGNRAPSLGR